VVAELAQAKVSRLRHAVLLYAGPGEFAAGVARFVEAAAPAGDPVLVACAAPGPGLLRPRLNGHGALVTWADMRSIGLNPARLIDTLSLFARQQHAPMRARRLLARQPRPVGLLPRIVMW